MKNRSREILNSSISYNAFFLFTNIHSFSEQLYHLSVILLNFDTPLERRTKVRLANLSKKIVPYHRWTGTIALLVIIVHAIFVTHRYGLHLHWSKMAVGLIAGFLLVGMVTTGWLRLFHPTVRKRKLHLYIGMTLFFLVFIHLLL
ncbi:hypothetical protein F3157_13660 [Virgibacillus dakarensis]|nr:hypothetical protein [Virgibacillus dakarensis]